jgi:non-homologous end joining protein Ku
MILGCPEGDIFKPDSQYRDAYNDHSLKGFQESLSKEQKVEFQLLSSKPPKPEDILELLNKIKDKYSKGRSY